MVGSPAARRYPVYAADNERVVVTGKQKGPRQRPLDHQMHRNVMRLAFVEQRPGDDALPVHLTDAKQLAGKRAGQAGLHPVDDRGAGEDFHSPTAIQLSEPVASTCAPVRL